MQTYEEITAKTALNPVSNSYLPYRYDLNPYRGCAHGCKYCFALYSHSYISRSDFYGDILVKTNIAELLDRELSKKSMSGKIINISGVTDCYQPCEEKYRLMRDILKCIIKHGNPVSISTKSDLILRDMDLIGELAEKTSVNIAATITTTDEALREKTEPGAVSTKRRFDMLKKAKSVGADTGVHIMPVIPYLTDNLQNLDEIFKITKELGLTYIIADPLNLKGKTKAVFMDFINKEYPSLFKPLLRLYRTGGYLAEDYLNEMAEKLNGLYKKYNIPAGRTRKKEKEYTQLTLF